MNFEEIKELIKENGIAGAGGAGFPSYAKLDKKIKTIILNCAECEPLFKMHRQLLANKAYEIVSMLNKVALAVEAEEFIVAVKAKYTKTVNAVKNALTDFKIGRLCLLSEVYPTGDEVVLIYETLKKVVPPGNIPLSVGVCVFNVETVLNMYNAVHNGTPVTKKYVTVAGEVKNPGTFCVPVGTPFHDVIEAAGGALIGDACIIKGGPMTGALSDEFDTVTKTTNGILLFPPKHPVIMKRKAKVSVSVARAKSTCCQCRMCTDLCPRGLIGMPVNPGAFMNAVANGATADTKVIRDAMYCVSCGLCEMYSCSQGLNPRSLIAEFKNKMLMQGIKNQVQDTPITAVNPVREYRKVPMKRLKERLDLIKYDKPADIRETEIEPKRIKVSLKQNIGVPSVPCVKSGELVAYGQKIADSADGLSLPIHSGIEGKVIGVTSSFIIIDRIIQ